MRIGSITLGNRKGIGLNVFDNSAAILNPKRNKKVEAPLPPIMWDKNTVSEKSDNICNVIIKGNWMVSV